MCVHDAFDKGVDERTVDRVTTRAYLDPKPKYFFTSSAASAITASDMLAVFVSSCPQLFHPSPNTLAIEVAAPVTEILVVSLLD
ncbi:hypothetical protein F2Q69_00027070 [Brassica cretica]|uniref:Uncharacterized protein n=2 Tax=Brassica cretica TaxID=69181 RepID=A0A3N6Q925_BRACR|nr:hypothetical protein F2Q69_00027070 [Brassica cretica]KAF3608200.1 hypothetical protein DY000_02045782 [Brassica cretica]